ncbi:MAG TPA: DUF6298 domain-containing protein [Cyclobacteriaceae bacterium]|nr:DUF6298 domain-containing protein [Cyclobacteriaceae bacterium]
MSIQRYLTVLFSLALLSCNEKRDPLIVSPINPRYFTNSSGKAVYLTGSHTWNNLVDMTYLDKTDTFDYTAFLEFLKKYNHNFYRLWAWELLNWNTNANDDENAKTYLVNPHPWLRTGPGTAVDGDLKFDLSKFNEDYFTRLRSRIEQANDYGLYVSIMLFEGWGIQFSPDAYQNHPFYPLNNFNDTGLDTTFASRLIIHELNNRKVLGLQENYLKKVIETVNDLDNVLYEISNENHPESTDWQYHMIRFIKDYESQLGNLHPVGMTFQYRGGSNRDLFGSPADWVSPNPEGGYRDDPPAADGSKVIVNDTDHLWGLGGNVGWVWKSFLRGMNPLFMDPYDGKVLMQSFDTDWSESIRRNLGYTNDFANRLDLVNMVPSGELTTTRYCLANSGKEYIVYFPSDTVATVDLTAVAGQLNAEWFDPVSGTSQSGGETQGGVIKQFTSPFNSGSAVLYLMLKE